MIDQAVAIHIDEWTNTWQTGSPGVDDSQEITDIHETIEIGIADFRQASEIPHPLALGVDGLPYNAAIVVRDVQDRTELPAFETGDASVHQELSKLPRSTSLCPGGRG